MSLKVELRPGERLLIGNCLVTNSDQRTRLFIDGDAPVLREKDILTAETATSPAQLIYFTVQLMYLDENVERHQQNYFELVSDFVHAVPSSTAILDEINNTILTKNLYKALKSAKKLVLYEQELMAHAATGSGSLPTNGPEDDKPA